MPFSPSGLTKSLALILPSRFKPIAIFPPVTHHVPEIQPIAVAATGATPSGERVAFYDQGAPLYDEMNQMLWYGGREISLLLSPGELEQALDARRTRVFVIDEGTYQTRFSSRIAHEVVAKAGHLLCVRLSP